jgi:hypothetical protein
MHSAEPWILEPSSFEVEFTIIEGMKTKSPGNDQISAELIYAGGSALHS